MGLRTWLGLKKAHKSAEKPYFHNEISHSQLQQDRWVLSEMSSKKAGFFVEIGAFDGKHLSNSYLLEKEYGWKGLLVEPNPKLSDVIRTTRTAILDTRPVDAASGNTVVMRFVVAEPELSSLASKAYSDKHADARSKESIEIKQNTVSLNDLLDFHNAPTEIDYISIDTEGNEFEILSTFDFDKYNVYLFSVEHNHTDAENEIEQLLTSKGYERVYKDWSRFDAWFRRKNSN